ncbi:MAG: tripartite tricarboxylate transporter substrate binding protein, partial [Ottowia sp.]|nr:tripartite tricarboxylate transporter substrate binding protein [Ottowia sp.]
LAKLHLDTWYRNWAAKGPPAGAENRPLGSICKGCQEPDAKAVWSGQGADFPGVSGQQFAKLIHTEIGQWAEVVKLSGARLE